MYLNRILSFSIIASLAVSALNADSFSTVEYVTVKSSQPIYSTVEEEVPTERCYDVKEPVSSGGNNSDIIGAVAGGAIGGILGHQIGGGKGKTAATVGGAVLGTLAGQKVGSSYKTPANDSYQVVRRCEVVKNYQTKKVLNGYENVGYLKGREIVVESTERMSKIPVTVTYSY